MGPHPEYDRENVSQKKKILWKDLVGHPFIALGRQNSIRHLVDAHAAQAGVELTTVFEVAFAWTVVGLVEAGLGVSLIPAYARLIVQMHPGVAMRPFETHGISRPISLLRRRQRSLSPAAETFRAFLHDSV